MGDIDKAMELARTVVGTPSGCGCKTCVEMYDAHKRSTTFDLARAVLAMAAVVEAGRKIVDAERYRPGDDRSMRLRQAIGHMQAAIRTLDAEARRG